MFKKFTRNDNYGLVRDDGDSRSKIALGDDSDDDDNPSSMSLSADEEGSTSTRCRQSLSSAASSIYDSTEVHPTFGTRTPMGKTATQHLLDLTREERLNQLHQRLHMPSAKKTSSSSPAESRPRGCR